MSKINQTMWADQQLRWWYHHNDTVKRKRSNQLISSFSQMHFHRDDDDDNICLSAVQTTQDTERSISGRRQKLVTLSDHPHGSLWSLNVRSWLENEFPRLSKKMEIRQVLTVLQRYKLSEQTRSHSIKEICKLTSSQDMLYSAKTVRQRAAILKEHRSRM